MIVTGKGSAGSWQIRGVQLGTAMGFDVRPQLQDARGKDIYLVKKSNGCSLVGHKKLIWDVVDFWPQPEGNLWTPNRLIDNIHKEAKTLKATHLIAATRRMADDLGTPYWLYHHGREYAYPHVAPEHVKVIGYEGSVKFLGRWESIIQEECKARGWRFVINPASITECQIVLALRDQPYKGYPTDCWKSNIKLQNAQNAGVPFIGNTEMGYTETHSGAEIFADTPKELSDAFDLLTPQSQRLWRSAKMLSKKYTVRDAAADLKRMKIC